LVLDSISIWVNNRFLQHYRRALSARVRRRFITITRPNFASAPGIGSGNQPLGGRNTGAAVKPDHKEIQHGASLDRRADALAAARRPRRRPQASNDARLPLLTGISGVIAVVLRG
jgi:hypothetical protein